MYLVGSMPRLPTSLLLRARKISPLLPLLLCTCRTLPSARNELRWLREHVLEIRKRKDQYQRKPEALLLHLCQKRSRGVPLQYLLGSQPFGNLDILCRPGVLIPRSDTEAYTAHLAKLLHQDKKLKGQKSLKILDLCTGTGCIPLSLYELLAPKFPETHICGADISDAALKLANDNLVHNIAMRHLPKSALHQISFIKADVLQDVFSPESISGTPQTSDVVISNPPYISQAGFGRDMERSVRNWEPKFALVPQIPKDVNLGRSRVEDVFYYSILDISKSVCARIVLMEVGDMQQAIRVSQIAIEMGIWTTIEIWRDWPEKDPDPVEDHEEVVISQHRVTVKGSGLGRSVLCRR